jgi:hypothetical protein
MRTPEYEAFKQQMEAANKAAQIRRDCLDRDDIRGAGMAFTDEVMHVDKARQIAGDNYHRYKTRFYKEETCEVVI